MNGRNVGNGVVNEDELAAGDPAEEAYLAEDTIAEEDEAEVEASGEGEEVSATPPPEYDLLNDVTQHYLNEIGAKPLFTAQEEYDWACRARAGEFLARQKMIEHNLRLVVNIAKPQLSG